MAEEASKLSILRIYWRTEKRSGRYVDRGEGRKE